MTKTEHKNYIKVAKDLCYSEEIIKRLEDAKDEAECTRIMKTARNLNK